MEHFQLQIVSFGIKGSGLVLSTSRYIHWKLSDWTLVLNEPLLTYDFGHINTSSQNEPHNFEHWTQISKRSTEIVLITLNTCMSHSVSTTVISQFILISSYSSLTHSSVAQREERLDPWVGRKSTSKKH
jgi:hypothetical protein